MIKLFSISSSLLFCLLFSGCGTASVATTSQAPSRTESREAVSDYDGGSELVTPRKLLYTADLGLVVEEPDSTIGQIIRLADKLGGYFSRTDAGGATIRVPANRLEEALSQIEAMGKTRYKRLTGEDVTEEYLDYGIRLDNAEKSRQRYLELLAKATNVEETLLVERELERLAMTIDALKGKRSRLDQLEAMATISVSVERKVKLGPIGAVFKGIFAGVKWLFVRK